MAKTTYNLTAPELLELENGVELTSESTTVLVDLSFTKGRVEQVNSRTFSYLEEDLIDSGEPVGKKETSAYEEMAYASKRIINNNTQIFSRMVSVSDTLNALSTAVGNELSYELEKARKAVKLDMERAFLYSVKKDEDDISGRQTEGLANQIPNVVNVNVDGLTPRRLTKADINKALYMSYQRGFSGEKVMMVNTSQKQVIDALYGENNTKHYLPGQNVMGDPLAEKIPTNFGVVSILLNSEMPLDEIYIFDATKIVLKRLRPLQVIDNLAKVDSTTKVAIEGEYGFMLEDRYHASKIIGLSVEEI